MRRLVTLAAVAALVALLALWWGGGFDRIAYWAAGQQRAFQNTSASALRAARAGQAGAVTALLAACFAYGVVHAAGPGHGKVLIGGYGMAKNVSKRKLGLIALASSLGQALTAIVLVYAGVALLGLGRETMIGVTETVMAPVSYGAIALVGLWLVWRGLRHLRPIRQDINEPSVCTSCGHAHGPTMAQVQNATTLRETIALIASIAVRPCTGALFVLIITWQMGIAPLGVAGAVAMALGTAVITIAAGLGAGILRSGMLAGAAGSARTVLLGAFVEIAAGGVVAVLATGLLLRAI
jgi:ABC-type nickel/cobalt efflux system permease component RcnA